MKKIFHTFLFSFFYVVILNPVIAQKLPNKQETSLRLPPDTRIDGTANEWKDTYQAFNKNTEIFYTIANDDENLYLLIHAEKSSIIEKMIEGGIAFTVIGNGKNKNAEDLTVLFPLMSMQKCQQILLSAGKKLSAGNYAIPIPSPLDTAYVAKLAKSIERANSQLLENMKEVKVSGIPLTDTVANVTDATPYYSYFPLRDHHFKIISINNEDNIHATTQFSDDGSYTYEMILPLKYLASYIADNGKLKYKVVIHGRGEDRRRGDTKWYGPLINGTKMILYQDMETPTDFSGEYTLAKKP